MFTVHTYWNKTEKSEFWQDFCQHWHYILADKDGLTENNITRTFNFQILNPADVQLLSTNKMIFFRCNDGPCMKCSCINFGRLVFLRASAWWIVVHTCVQSHVYYAGHSSGELQFVWVHALWINPSQSPLSTTCCVLIGKVQVDVRFRN